MKHFKGIMQYSDIVINDVTQLLKYPNTHTPPSIACMCPIIFCCPCLLRVLMPHLQSGGFTFFIGPQLHQA